MLKDKKSQQKSYPNKMLPAVSYKGLGNDSYSYQIVDLEYKTMEDLSNFIGACKNILIRENMIQTPELMVAHLCAYLGFLTVVGLGLKEALQIQPEILALLETQSHQSYQLFLKYPVYSNTLDKDDEENNFEKLRNNSPGSLLVQTLRLGRVIFDVMGELGRKRSSNSLYLDEKQTELFCPQKDLLEVLKTLSSQNIKQLDNTVPVIYLINQVVFQIGWLMGYYAYLDQQPPLKFLNYGLPCVDLYIESPLSAWPDQHYRS